MSQAKIVHLLLVGREKEPVQGEPQPRFGIQMPLGGKILGATIAAPVPGDAPQLMLAVVSAPNAVVAFTPLHVCGLGELMTPLIGRRVGECVATTSAPNGLPVFVFLDEPAAAPTSDLISAKAEGHG